VSRPQLSMISLALLVAVFLTGGGAPQPAVAGGQAPGQSATPARSSSSLASDGEPRTFSSSLGYEFQFPSTWKSTSTPHHVQIDNVAADFDTEFTSPDGIYKVVPAVYTGIPNVEALVSSFSASSVLRSDGEDIDVLRLPLPISGGGVVYAVKLPRTIDPILLSGPEAIAVPNADAAIRITISTTLEDGSGAVIGVVMAARGQTAYVLDVFALSATDQASSEINEILNTLQLGPVGTTRATPSNGV
jgi:hypothetical protein